MKHLTLLILFAWCNLLIAQIASPTKPILTYYDNPGVSAGSVSIFSGMGFDDQGTVGGGFWRHTLNANFFDNFMRMTNGNSSGSVLVLLPNANHGSFTSFRKNVMENRGWTVTGQTISSTSTPYTSNGSLDNYDVVIIGFGGSGNTSFADNVTFNSVLNDYVLSRNGNLIVSGWCLGMSGALKTTLLSISPFSAFSFGFSYNVTAYDSWKFSANSFSGNHQVFTSPYSASWVGGVNGGTVVSQGTTYNFGNCWGTCPTSFTLRSGAICLAEVDTPAGMPANPAIPTVIPSVVSNPSTSTVSICQNGLAPTYSVSFNNATAYQWQVSTDNGLAWSNVSSGGTSTTYSPSSSIAGSYIFRCGAVNGSSSTSYSNASGVYTVNASPSTPNVAVGGSPSLCSGGSVLLTSNQATGNQWYKDGIAISGETNTNTTVSEVGSYTVIATVNGCSSAASTPVVVSQLAAPAITTHPTTASQSGLSGATVSVTATGAGLTYQWYSNTTASNSNGTLISGATSSSYTPAPTSNTYYYCVVTGACGTVTSDVSGAVSGIPVTLLQSSQWNASIGASTAIVVNYVFGATHYKYKLVSSAGTEYVTLTRRWIYPHEIPNMLYGRTYTLSVSVSGNGTTFGAFGTEKDFTMVTTSLTTSSGAVSYGTPISASYLPYFTNYKFKVESVEDGVQYVEVPRRWMYPYEIPNMVYGRSYTISVAIQNSFNSSYSAYGQSNSIVCTTTAPSMETPSSTIGIWSPIIAAHMTGFTSYKYKLEPVGGGTTLYVEVPRRWFYPYEAAVTIGASYNVSVAVKNNIGTSAYSEYSASVAYTVSSATTSLQQYLCGTNVNSTTSLASYEVQDAQEYRYRLRNTSTNVVYVYYSTTNSMTIAAYDTYAQANNLPALPSGTYSVAVAYTLDSEIGPYSANGSLCEINYTAPQGLAIQDPQLHEEQAEVIQTEEVTNTTETTATLTETTPNSTWTATATSNPFALSFQIKLNGAEGINSAASFSAQLTDMSGKVYSQATLNKEQLEAESFGEQLAPGMYLMTLRQGEELRVIRVVKR